MNRCKRIARTGVVTTAIALALCGCGTKDGEGDPVTESRKTAAAPRSTISMEQAIGNLQTMRHEMFDRLDARFGKKPWKIAPNEEAGIGRSGCHDDTVKDGETAYLPIYGFAGTFPEDQWQEAFSIVRKVGATYGFDDVTLVVDRPGDHEIDARDHTGAQYVFTMSKGTGLLIHSGCHAWDTPPAPGRAPE